MDVCADSQDLVSDESDKSSGTYYHSLAFQIMGMVGHQHNCTHQTARPVFF